MTTLISLSFKRLKSEPCIFVRKNNQFLIIIALYVDDLLIFSNNEEENIKIKKELMLRFEMQDLGKAKSILRIIQEKGMITLDQSKYIENVLDKFNMRNCKPINTPLEVNKKWLESKQKEIVCDERMPYQNLIGCLMYIAVCNRPDIMHAISVLSQFNNYYEAKHWQAAKRY